MRNALAGNLSPSLTACNRRPRWLCTEDWSVLYLPLAFCSQALVWELVCWWSLGYWPPITVLDDLSPDLYAAWSVGGHLVTDPPITSLGDRLPCLSVTWSTCHPVSGPRGSLLLTSSATDDRSDQRLKCFSMQREKQPIKVSRQSVVCQLAGKRVFETFFWISCITVKIIQSVKSQF